MTEQQQSGVDTILDALGDDATGDLLGRLPPVDDAVDAATLVDIGADRGAVQGDGAAAEELVALAQRWFGDGREAGRLEANALTLRVRNSVVLLQRKPSGVAVAALTARLDIARLRQMFRQLGPLLGRPDASPALPGEVQQAWAADAGALRTVYERSGSHVAATVAEYARSGSLRDAVTAWNDGEARAPALAGLDGIAIDQGERVLELVRVPFVPRLVMVATAPAAAGQRLWARADHLATEILREVMRDLLADGFETQLEPFPDTDVQFEQIVRQLRNLDPDDLDGRLRLGGFADHPVDGTDGTMRCQECIYYLPHRRWCDLPELPLPVDPDWYCRLWKL